MFLQEFPFPFLKKYVILALCQYCFGWQVYATGTVISAVVIVALCFHISVCLWLQLNMSCMFLNTLCCVAMEMKHCTERYYMCVCGGPEGTGSCKWSRLCWDGELGKGQSALNPQHCCWHACVKYASVFIQLAGMKTRQSLGIFLVSHCREVCCAGTCVTTCILWSYQRPTSCVPLPRQHMCPFQTSTTLSLP